MCRKKKKQLKNFVYIHKQHDVDIYSTAEIIQALKSTNPCRKKKSHVFTNGTFLPLHCQYTPQWTHIIFFFNQSNNMSFYSTIILLTSKVVIYRIQHTIAHAVSFQNVQLHNTQTQFIWEENNFFQKQHNFIHSYSLYIKSAILRYSYTCIQQTYQGPWFTYVKSNKTDELY